MATLGVTIEKSFRNVNYYKAFDPTNVYQVVSTNPQTYTTDNIPEGNLLDRLYVNTIQKNVLEILDQFGFSIPTAGTLLFDGNFAATKEIQAWSDDGTGLPASLLDALPIASTTSTGIAQFSASNFAVDANGLVTLVSGAGGGMVFPAAGIPVSTGTGWGTSITDNSDNWNTAYGWGDWHHTTLSGYGITDSYTKTDADSRFVNVTGDTMTGNLTFSVDSLGIQFFSDNYLRKQSGTGMVLTVDASRSPNLFLQFEHGTGGAMYYAYHSGNANLTSVDWAAQNLTLAGTITGATSITTGSITPTNLSTGYLPYMNGSLVNSPISVDANGNIKVTGNLYATGEIQAWADDGSGLPASLLDALPIATTTSTGIMQIGSGLSVDANGVVSVTTAGGGTAAIWGNITGTLSDQTDLQTALNGKEPAFTKNTAFNKDFGTATGQVWGYDAHPTTTSGYGLPAYPTTLPASDVYAWAKAATKPSYTTDEVSEGSTNLYYTDARVAAKVTQSYVNGLGVSYNSLSDQPVSILGSDVLYVPSDPTSSGDRTQKIYKGIAIYTGYNNPDSIRPTKYDITLSVNNSGKAFEIAANWSNTNKTPLYVRSLRDCCQGWSDWTEIYTSGTSNLTTVDWSAKNLTLAGSITGATSITTGSITPTNLTTGYLPYKSSGSLVNSPVYTDGVKVGIGTTPAALLDIAGAFPTQVRFPNGSVIATDGPGIAFTSYSDTGFSANDTNFSFWESGVIGLNISDAVKEIRVPSDYKFSFSSVTNNNASSDTFLYRNSAGILRTEGGAIIDGNTFLGYTSDPTSGNKLAVNGNGYFAGNVTATGEVTAWTASDIRLKENVQTITNANQLIGQFRPVTHYWNGLAKELNPAKDNRLNYGLIAQEVQAIAPEFVHPLYDDYLSIDYVSFVPLLIAGEQEHEAKIKQLEQRISELENELKKYKN